MVEASIVNYAELAVLAVGVAIALIQLKDLNRTRTAELYLRLWERWNTKEFSEQRYEAYRMQWNDHDDFYEKYSPLKNPNIFASWNTFGRTINGVAELERKKLISVDFLDREMITDIVRWWMVFGQLEKDAWKKGRPGWPGHFPFIKDVIEHHRKTAPYLYDEETDDMIIPPEYNRTWVRPEEIEHLRRQLIH